MKAQTLEPCAESVCIVDGEDRPVEVVSRDQMRRNGLLHRVTFVLVFNARGEILVQTRTPHKDWYPGRIDLAAGGVMTAGESYAESAGRELYEELGVRAALDFQFKIYFEDNNSRPSAKSWGAVYSCLAEGPFVLQQEEVAQVCFMTIGDALKIPADRTTPDTRLVLVAHVLGGGRMKQ